jgi:hypothetical protein
MTGGKTPGHLVTPYLQKRSTHVGLWRGLIRYQWLNCSTFGANVNL